MCPCCGLLIENYYRSNGFNLYGLRVRVRGCVVCGSNHLHLRPVRHTMPCVKENIVRWSLSGWPLTKLTHTPRRSALRPTSSCALFATIVTSSAPQNGPRGIGGDVATCLCVCWPANFVRLNRFPLTSINVACKKYIMQMVRTYARGEPCRRAKGARILSTGGMIPKPKSVRRCRPGPHRRAGRPNISRMSLLCNIRARLSGRNTTEKVLNLYPG